MGVRSRREDVVQCINVQRMEGGVGESRTRFTCAFAKLGGGSQDPSFMSGWPTLVRHYQTQVIAHSV
jgi:hypothetical protein